MCNQYRRFVKKYTDIARPLNDTLKKNQPDKLGPATPEQLGSFNTWKGELLKAPILHLPVKGIPYSVDTDASNCGLGATLFQNNPDGNRYHIGYWSRKLNEHELNYTTP